MVAYLVITLCAKGGEGEGEGGSGGRGGEEGERGTRKGADFFQEEHLFTKESLDAFLDYSLLFSLKVYFHTNGM